MPERFFSGKRIEQLRQLAEIGWGDAKKLKAILDELEHRTTSAAIALRARVQARMDELTSNPLSTKTGCSDDERRRELESLRAQVNRLTRERDEAVRRADLAERLGRAVQGDADCRTVGVDPNAPDYVLDAVRKAHAKELHPDSNINRDTATRREREKALQEINAAWDRIEQRRKRKAA